MDMFEIEKKIDNINKTINNIKELTESGNFARKVDIVSELTKSNNIINKKISYLNSTIKTISAISSNQIVKSIASGDKNASKLSWLISDGLQNTNEKIADNQRLLIDNSKSTKLLLRSNNNIIDNIKSFTLDFNDFKNEFKDEYKNAKEFKENIISSGKEKIDKIKEEVGWVRTMLETLTIPFVLGAATGEYLPDEIARAMRQGLRYGRKYYEPFLTQRNLIKKATTFGAKVTKNIVVGTTKNITEKTKNFLSPKKKALTEEVQNLTNKTKQKIGGILDDAGITKNLDNVKSSNVTKEMGEQLSKAKAKASSLAGSAAEVASEKIGIVSSKIDNTLSKMKESEFLKKVDRKEIVNRLDILRESVQTIGKRMANQTTFLGKLSELVDSLKDFRLFKQIGEFIHKTVFFGLSQIPFVGKLFEPASKVVKPVVSGAKIAGKFLYQTMIRKFFPVFNVGLTAALAADRFSKGEYVAGAFEIASGLASFVLPWGPLVSLLIDGGLIAYDHDLISKLWDWLIRGSNSRLPKESTLKIPKGYRATGSATNSPGARRFKILERQTSDFNDYLREGFYKEIPDIIVPDNSTLISDIDVYNQLIRLQKQEIEMMEESDEDSIKKGLYKKEKQKIIEQYEKQIEWKRNELKRIRRQIKEDIPNDSEIINRKKIIEDMDKQISLIKNTHPNIMNEQSKKILIESYEKEKIKRLEELKILEKKKSEELEKERLRREDLIISEKEEAKKLLKNGLSYRGNGMTDRIGVYMLPIVERQTIIRENSIPREGKYMMPPDVNLMVS